MNAVMEQYPNGVSKAEDIEQIMELGMQHILQKHARNLTFKQLAKRHCNDGVVHYTTSGGRKGGEELGKTVKALEEHYGHGPELLLSVDTMAFVPENVLEKYPCFSTHPGPLDSIRVEGMQGTLRSLVEQVLYDRNGMPLPKDHVFGMGEAYVKGTLFLQAPVLDKGPPIDTVLCPVCPGVSAYQARDDVYDTLIDAMIKRLPVLLDSEARTSLIEHAQEKKAALDAAPHVYIDKLEEKRFATWQSACWAVPHDASPTGAAVIQHQIVDPAYFYQTMQGFYPGYPEDFARVYEAVFSDTTERIKAQKAEYRRRDLWAEFAYGEHEVTYPQPNHATGQIAVIFNNRIPVLNPFHPQFRNSVEPDMEAFHTLLLQHLGGAQQVAQMGIPALQERLHQLLETERPADLIAAMPEAFREPQPHPRKGKRQLLEGGPTRPGRKRNDPQGGNAL